MAHYPDMGTESEVDSGDHVRAVGWLHPDYPFLQGKVSREFLDRLNEFADRWGDSTEALYWGAAGGVHGCEFCCKVHASGNFGVPKGNILFVAPEMIAHYVEVHSYLPPAEFIAAVLASPLPGTEEYKAAVESFRQL